MKKTVLVLFSLLMTLGLTTNVNAQSTLSYGMKAEMNMSNFILTDLDNASSKMMVGPNLGLFMHIDLHENFALQPELSFFYKNSKLEDGFYNDTFQQWGMQVPIYALGKTEVGNGKFYAGLGPYLGLGFNAHLKDEDINLYKEILGETPLNRWDFGFGALVGYEFNNGFQLNASYQIGVINQFDAIKDDAKINNQTVNIGIGYRF